MRPASALARPRSLNKFDVNGAASIGYQNTAAPTSGLIVSGNVGIGTATVANKFDVNGAVSIGYQNTAAPSSGLLVSGNVGIGTSTVTNKLDINGGIAVGTQYAGAAAPTSGLIVQGNVGIGTKSPGALFTVGSNSFEVNSAGTVLAGTWNASTVTVPYGGTGDTTLTLHGIMLGEGTSAVTVTSAGTSGQLMQSGGSLADPNWTSATYPASTTANQLLYSSATNTVTGLATSTNSILVTDGSGVPSIGSTLPTAVQGNITRTGTITTGTWNASTVTVPYGGTGDTTLTLHGVMLGEGTSAVAVTTAGTTGYLLTSGGASADPTFGQINLGTSPAITGTLGVTNGGTGTATSFTQGSIVFAGASGVYSQDNANFFWNATTHRLGIGSTAPVASLDMSQETDALALPVGTTFQEPAAPVNGMIRYNKSIGDIEAYIAGAWTALTTGGSLAAITLGTSASTPDPSSSFSATTGLYSDGASAVEVAISGGEKLLVNATGVGIGTSTIANALDVNGAASVGYKNTAAPTNGAIILGNVGIGTATVANAFDVNGAASIGYKNTAAAANSLIVSGTVGVGTATVANALDVNGAASVGYKNTAAPTNGAIILGNVGVGTATVANAFDVNGAASIGYKNTAAPSSGLLVSGNVGIGTSTVTNKLDINGGIAVGTQYAGCCRTHQLTLPKAMSASGICGKRLGSNWP